MNGTKKSHTHALIFQTAVLALAVVCLAAPALRSQFREVHLPYRDTTRVKVQFLDSLHGWVVNHRGTILRTTDGGVQWTEHHFTADSTIDGLEFVDRLNGWLLVVDGRPAVENYSTRLYTTRDGGESWERVPFPDTLTLTPRPNAGYWATPYFRIAMYRNMEFVDSATVYVEARGKYGRPYMKYMCWRTTDRGTTWVEIPTNSNSSSYSTYYARHLAVIDHLRMFIVYCAPGMVDMESSVIESSTDGGATWTSDALRETGVMNIIKSHDAVYFGYFVGRTMYGPRYEGFSNTIDGGRTWRGLPEPWIGAKMAYLMSDSSVWSIGADTSSREKRILINGDGALVRLRKQHAPVLKYPKPIRWLSKAGELLYALTGDGKVIVFDSRLVRVEEPQEQEKSPRDLTVYPNPAREQVSVVCPTDATTELVISDLHGRILHRQTTHGQSSGNSTSTISIRNYAPGVYHLQVIGASTRRSTVFLKY